MTHFQLHPRLQQDCFTVGRLALSQLLMMNDSQYPWFILVPRRPEITEIYQLTEEDRQMLLAESCALAETLQAIYQPDKLNIATIGNLVPQLHVHHVARYQADKSWPAPVWGKLPALAYTQQQAEFQISRLREALAGRLLD
jgi:diadenosine tetraphosphate (Ap4A) HIT family hydrolase